MKIILNNSNSTLNHRIKIHNVYNEFDTRSSSTLNTLKIELNKNKKQIKNENEKNTKYIQNVIVKNFNTHHSQ